jgi:putative phosphoribosyl transferase
MPTTEIQRGVCVEAAGARLAGEMHLPPDPRGFVLFASSRDLMRLDRRQLDLSEALNHRGLGTLLFDLVQTTDPADVGGDLEVLTERLLAATEWSGEQWGVEELPIGYVGSGLGSAAALVAAAALGPKIWALSIHGGRPDLAGDGLGKVQAPTLLLVDPADPLEVQAVGAAAARLRAPHRIRRRKSVAAGPGVWQSAPAICHWMEWYLEQHELLR